MVIQINLIRRLMVPNGGSWLMVSSMVMVDAKSDFKATLVIQYRDSWRLNMGGIPNQQVLQPLQQKGPSP